MNDGLVAYYPFNGNANDESGNGNSGSVNGATITKDPWGNKASAYSFDGVNDSISIPNSPSINITGDLTLAAWIKPISYKMTNNEYKTIIWGKTSYYLSLNRENSSLANYKYGMNNPGYHLTLPDTVPIGKYTHIAAVWDGNMLKQFINGILVNTILDVYGVARQTTGGVMIGCESGNRAFHGNIDEVRIYNRALSDSEIQQLYQPVKPSSDDCWATYENGKLHIPLNNIFSLLVIT